MFASKLAAALAVSLFILAAGWTTTLQAQDELPTTRPVVAPVVQPTVTPPAHPIAPATTDLAPLPPRPRQDEAAVRIMGEAVAVPPTPIPQTVPKIDEPMVRPMTDARKTTLVKYPDGWSLVNRQGRLIRSKGQSFFLFDSDDTPIQLIANRQRETMEDLSQMGRRTIRFRISGLVTEYRGKNHLLLQMVLVERGRVGQ